MKLMFIGFVLGVIVCLSMGAALYHPVKGVVVMTAPGPRTNFETVMKNQEAIFNLINAKCGNN